MEIALKHKQQNDSTTNTPLNSKSNSYEDASDNSPKLEHKAEDITEKTVDDVVDNHKHVYNTDMVADIPLRTDREKKSVYMHILVTPSLRQTIKDCAQAEKISINAMLTTAILEHIKKVRG